MDGIAAAYVYPDDLINVDWWYNWGPCPDAPLGCVPMSWAGTDPNLDANYSSYVLLFNEPDRPDQSNILPEIAIVMYKELKAKYPLAKWVVGNTFYPNWLYTFKDLCAADPDCIMPEYWGLHAYMGGAEYLPMMRTELTKAHNILGGKIWITEYASVTGDITADEGLRMFFKANKWIERWAYFTNRAQGTEWWYPTGWDVVLKEWETGNLTRIGDWFYNGLDKQYIPMVRRDRSR
jgi:hypothetical protein